MRCDVPLGPTISETPTVEIVALRWPKLPQLPDPLPHVTVNEAADTLTMEDERHDSYQDDGDDDAFYAADDYDY